jgi:hypothetical protein
MDGIESRLSNNLTSCVSETRKQSTMMQEELIATKATLAAERQQKKEYKKEATETLNEHVEIFGKISDAATKPLMEVMRLFTQNTMAKFKRAVLQVQPRPISRSNKHQQFRQHLRYYITITSISIIRYFHQVLMLQYYLRWNKL